MAVSIGNTVIGRRRSRPGLALALMIAACRVAGAGVPDYIVDVWDTERELPNSSVTALAQTPDGYLWVGTYNGLARFDGVRFVTFHPGNTPALGHARIQDLYVDVLGTLWINTYRGGLISCNAGRFHREYERQEGFDLHTSLALSESNRIVFATQYGAVLQRDPTPGSQDKWVEHSQPSGQRLKFYCADRQGNLWFLRRDARIVRWTTGGFRELPANSGLTGSRVLTLAADASGQVVAGTDQEIARWDGQRFVTLTPTNGEPVLDTSYILPVRDGAMWVLANGKLRKQSGRRWVAEAKEWEGLLGWASGRSMGMHEDRAGGVWFNHYGNGLFHITPEGQYQRFTTRDGLPSDRVWAWFEGREGDIWLGVDRGGLTRLRERRFQVIGTGEGLPVRGAISVCQGTDGAMWFGTFGGGLCRWQEFPMQVFPIGTDPSENFVFSIYPGRDRLWLSASAGEDWYQFRDGQVERAPAEVHGIKVMLQDRSGRVWLGTKVGLTLWQGQTLKTFGLADGMSPSAVRALTEGPDGSIWCGNDDGTLYRCSPERVVPARPPDQLGGQPIWTLLVDKTGALWAGTFRGGLLRYRNERFQRVTTDQGLPSDVVGEVLEDDQGQLWLGTHKGICRVHQGDLNNVLEGRARRLECVTYGLLDGLPTLECAGDYQPACWKAKDGRLWFATIKGMVSVQPDKVKNNPVPPTVVVEELRVDGEKLGLHAGRIVVPPGREQFEFRYTGLSFIASDNVRFRYRLVGLESDWVEADTRRTVVYGHLTARDYQFQVLACNNDGIWNREPAVVAFTVLPHFYESWWFLAALGTAVLGGVALGVRNLTRRKYRLAMAHLEQQHAVERDRTRIAKDIHDDLGAGLTQITLLSELARREPPEQVGSHLDRISTAARGMTRAMDEIVWAVDPQHDTLNGLMDYISVFTEDFLRTAGVRCRMELPTELPELRVDAEQRYNLFLALKEALNNVVKHAQATEVWLKLELPAGGLKLVVEDNGKGLPREPAPESGGRLVSGHGLPNLEKRLAAIGGACRVSSVPGKGTRIEMTVQIKPMPSPIVATGQNLSHGSE